MNLSLLLISALLALAGLLVFFSSPLRSEDEEDFHPDARFLILIQAKSKVCYDKPP